MRSRLAAVVLAALATTAHADEWTRRDTAIEAVVLSAFAADYLQTRQVVADGMEGNPLIGPDGARVHPFVYFSAVATLHAVAMRALPAKWRPLAQGLTLGVQAVVIHDNWIAGYAVQF